MARGPAGGARRARGARAGRRTGDSQPRHSQSRSAAVCRGTRAARARCSLMWRGRVRSARAAAARSEIWESARPDTARRLVAGLAGFMSAAADVRALDRASRRRAGARAAGAQLRGAVRDRVERDDWLRFKCASAREDGGQRLRVAGRLELAGGRSAAGESDALASRRRRAARATRAEDERARSQRGPDRACDRQTAAGCAHGSPAGRRWRASSSTGARARRALEQGIHGVGGARDSCARSTISRWCARRSRRWPKRRRRSRSRGRARRSARAARACRAVFASLASVPATGAATTDRVCRPPASRTRNRRAAPTTARRAPTPRSTRSARAATPPAKRFPPNFLSGSAERVVASVKHCAPRIYARLAMWRVAPAVRDKTPMPPPLAAARRDRYSAPASVARAGARRRRDCCAPRAATRRASRSCSPAATRPCVRASR